MSVLQKSDSPVALESQGRLLVQDLCSLLSEQDIDGSLGRFRELDLGVTPLDLSSAEGFTQEVGAAIRFHLETAHGLIHGESSGAQIGDALTHIRTAQSVIDFLNAELVRASDPLKAFEYSRFEHSMGPGTQFVRPSNVSLREMVQSINRRSQQLYERDAINEASLVAALYPSDLTSIDRKSDERTIYRTIPHAINVQGKTDASPYITFPKTAEMGEISVIAAIAAGLQRLEHGFPQNESGVILLNRVGSFRQDPGDALGGLVVSYARYGLPLKTNLSGVGPYNPKGGMLLIYVGGLLSE